MPTRMVLPRDLQDLLEVVEFLGIGVVLFLVVLQISMVFMTHSMLSFLQPYLLLNWPKKKVGISYD